jgi:4-amino-4-deoxy-L-arabinose transferase-like glycosyltransferase
MTLAPKTAEGRGRTVQVVSAKRLAPQAGRSAARRALVVVGALTTAGLVLRLPSFDDALFGDELATYFIVTGNSFDRVIWLLQGNSATGDLSPPLFFLVAAVTERLGHTAELLRLSSLVAGSAAIPLTYVLGLWTVGRRAALVGATLTALSPFLIFYSTEARAYALVLVLVLLSTLALLRALDTGRFTWWAAYAVCSCAAMYTHYPAVFVLAAQFGWAFWTRPAARRALLAANVAAAVGYLPWLPTLMDNAGSPGSDVIGFLHPFTLDNVRTDLGRWFFGHPYISLTSMPGPVATVMLGAGLAAGLLGLALKARRGVRSHDALGLSSGLVLVLVLAVATPVLIALYSTIGDSVWGSRYLVASWPGLALAVGALLTRGVGVPRLVALGLVLGAFGIGAVQMLRADFQRPDYEAAAGFIESIGSSGDPVVEVPQPTPGPLAPVGDVALNRFRQSMRERHPVLRLGFPPRDELLRARPYDSPPAPSAEAIARQAADLARGRRVFVVVPAPSALSWFLLGGFQDALPQRLQPIETRTFPGFLEVMVVVYRDGEDPSGR